MNDVTKVLLVIPPTYEDIYGSSFIKSGINPAYMVLSYAAISGSLKEEKYKVRLIDLNASRSPKSDYIRLINDFEPDFIGFNITTPIFNKVDEYAKYTKEELHNSVLIAGGPHVSVMPEGILRNSCFDIAVVGEGDYSFRRIVDRDNLKDIPGIAYLDSGEYKQNINSLIKNLDDLPFPYMELYDPQIYIHPNSVSRRNPVASMETSRGCFGRCVFCNKSVFGAKLRLKSVDRVIEEMKYILSLGYNELHLVDDLFTASLTRAKKICERIINERLNMSWMPRGGIRVDVVDQELLYLFKRAGVWRVAFGIESGSQKVLNESNKMITLSQVNKAVRMARKAGLETEGYFMLGLPGETEETLKETMKYAKSLRLDFAKFAVTIPLPGTSMFDKWDSMGAIKTKDWSKYTFSTKTRDLYDHPTVSWSIIDRYFESSHRNFYLRPSYILERLYKSTLSGQLLNDVRAFFSIKWF